MSKIKVKLLSQVLVTGNNDNLIVTTIIDSKDRLWINIPRENSSWTMQELPDDPDLAK